MKIHELLKEESKRIRLSPMWLSRVMNKIPYWSNTQKIECTNCEGTGRSLGLIGYKNCKECNGTGTLIIDNSKNFVEYTPEQIKSIESLLGIDDITNNNIITQDRISEILQKTLKFINTDQTHLDNPGSVKFTRRVERDPTTKILTIKPIETITEPVNSKDLVELMKKFSNFLHAVQEVQAVIHVETRY